MHLQLWPVATRYAELASDDDFKIAKNETLARLAEAGHELSEDSAMDDILDLPGLGHAAFTTKDPKGENSWNLKFGRRHLGLLQLFWTSSSASGARWRNALASSSVRNLIESCTFDVAIGYADSFPGGQLMGYKTLLSGPSVLARPSWAYVYSKCLDDPKILSQISHALREKTVSWIRDLETFLRDHTPGGNEIKILSLKRRETAKALRSFESTLVSNGGVEGLALLLKQCGLNWSTWRVS